MRGPCETVAGPSEGQGVNTTPSKLQRFGVVPTIKNPRVRDKWHHSACKAMPAHPALTTVALAWLCFPSSYRRPCRSLGNFFVTKKSIYPMKFLWPTCAMTSIAIADDEF